jgi:hypothetical protein
MDLNPLKLEHLTRAPHLMLLRNEWNNVVDIFNKRLNGIRGCAIFIGLEFVSTVIALEFALSTNGLLFEGQNWLVVLHPYPLHYLCPANCVSGYEGRSLLY